MEHPPQASAVWDERYRQAELVWSATPNQFVAEVFGPLPPGRALDLAAGEGRNALWLAERGWAVTAVDFSAVAVDKGRRWARERGVSVDWVVADLVDHIPTPGAHAGVVVAYLHLPADIRAVVLGRATAALAPGGTLLVVGHDLTNLTEGVGGPRDPEVLYTPEAVVADLARALAGSGAPRVVRAERVRRGVDGDTGPLTAVDTLVCAVRDR